MPDNRSTLASRSYGLLKWLLALLIVVGIIYLLTHTEEAQDYGKQTLQKSEGFTSRVMTKTRQIYACITSDCSLRVDQAPQLAARNDAAPARTLSGSGTTAAAAAPGCITCPPYLDMGASNGSQPAASNPLDAATDAEGRSPAALPPAYPYYPGKAEAAVAPGQPASESLTTAPPLPALAESAATPAAPMVTAKPAAVPEPSKAQLRARGWAAQKKYAYAAIAYKKHLAVYPNDYNAYGELGNVYLLEKDYPRAAQSYYEAAKRLLSAGHTQTVLPLLPVITQYQPKLAAELRTQMAAPAAQ